MVNKLKQERIKRMKLLKEWSQAVRQRDSNQCQICGDTSFLNAHHLFPKEAKMYNYLMYDIDNGITLCSGHHKFSYQISPHKNPLMFVNWLIVNKNEQMHRLEAKHNK